MQLVGGLELFSAPLVFACGEPVATTVSNEAADAEVVQDANDDADVAAGDAPADVRLACGAHAVTGPLLAVEPISSFPPANLGSTGGKVVDGHYVATRFRRFGTSNAGGRKAADLWISNGRYEWEDADENTGGWSSAGTITYSGGDMKMAHDCKKYYALAFSYATSAAGLVLRLSDGQGHTLVIDMTLSSQ